MRTLVARPYGPVVLLLLALLAGGCGGGGGVAEPPTGSVGADGSVDPALLEPLTGLGRCDSPPGGTHSNADIEGLVLPPTSVVTEVTGVEPLTQVRGYIERTPVEIRVFYADGSAGVEVLTIEDEIREAEVLADSGSARMFLKAQAVCERGSVFVAFVAPAGETERLPAPTLGGN